MRASSYHRGGQLVGSGSPTSTPNSGVLTPLPTPDPKLLTSSRAGRLRGQGLIEAASGETMIHPSCSMIGLVEH